MKRKAQRDVEKTYPKHEFIKKLRRVADALEHDEPFRLQIGGERLLIPADAVFTIEHERERGLEEIEFQFRWRPKRSRS